MELNWTQISELIDSLINADQLDVEIFWQGIWEFWAKTQHF